MSDLFDRILLLVTLSTMALNAYDGNLNATLGWLSCSILLIERVINRSNDDS